MSPVSPDHPCGAANADLRYQALFEQAPLSIQILAPGGRTLRVNQAWQTLWQIHAGTALYDFVFSDAYNVLTDPQLLASGIAPLLQRAFDGEAVTIPAARYDVAALGSGGPARWVTARAHPIRDAAGKVLEVMLMHEDGAIREWMGANTDIHDRVMAELALAERDRRKDHFLAMLAHELRNPLAPITSAAQLPAAA